MKITFVLPTAGLCGGIRVVAIYAQLLQQRGHEVFIVSVAHPKPSLREQLRSLKKGRGWINVPKNPPSHLDRLDIPHKIIDVGHELTDEDLPDADVVVATFWLTANWVANLSPTKGAKAYFVQGHEVFADGGAATYSLPLHKIVISRYLERLMIEEYHQSDLSFVPNSVDLQQFNASVRSKQDVLTLGMLYNSDDCSKGCDLTLRAVAIAKQDIPNLRLVAFGVDNPSEELPLPPNTEYIRQPAQDRIKDIYSQCDAWLCGSRDEGFCLPILEAMACRTPVISTPVGAAPELLKGRTGILVKPEDPLDMARAIALMHRLSNGEWQAMSERAYAQANGYSWHDAATLFEAALQKAIDSKFALSSAN